jgi:uncharacterized membrane protein YccC
LRLLAALRATLAGLLTFVLVMLLGSVAAVPVTDRLLGFAIALFIAANVRDGTMRQRLVTIALAPVFAFVATAIAALLFDRPLAAAALLPLIMFVVTCGAQRGPRWATIGIVALIGYFIGLVTHQPPASLPMRLVVLLLAAGDAALIRCLLLPERPGAELERLRHAIHAGIVHVLDRIAAAVEAGAWTGRSRAALRREVQRLDDVVMLAQARAAQLPGQENPWLHLLAVQLAIERLARVALEDLGTPADQARLRAMLAALQGDAEPPRTPTTSRLASALALLGHAMHAGPQEAMTPAAAPPPASSAPALRSAVLTGIATALAIIVGDAVSPNRWYWAAFAAYVMFQGTRSRGETLAKGVQFVIGTLAGVVAGVLLATLLSGHDILTMAAIVTAVFLAFQANVAAYGAMVFWITVILGLLFGMLGFFPPELLLLRLKESAVGAACGVLVAYTAPVRRERAAVEDAMRAFLQALGRSVAGAAQSLLDGTPAPDLAACILLAEQRFRDLGAIAQAERLALVVPARGEPLRRRMLLLEGCERWSRELGQIGLQAVGPADPALAGPVREIASGIDRTLSRLVDRRPAARGADEEPAAAPVATPGDELPRAVRLLLRIDSALVHMAAR